MKLSGVLYRRWRGRVKKSRFLPVIVEPEEEFGLGTPIPIVVPENTFSASNADESGRVLGEVIDLGATGPRVFTDAAVSDYTFDLMALTEWSYLLFTSPDPAADPTLLINGIFTDQIANSAGITGVPVVVDRYIRPSVIFLQASDIPDNLAAFVTIGVTFMGR